MFYIIGHLFYSIIGAAMITDAVVEKPIFKVEQGVEVVQIADASAGILSDAISAQVGHQVQIVNVNDYSN